MLLIILFNAVGTMLFEPDSSTGKNHIGVTVQIKHDNMGNCHYLMFLKLLDNLAQKSYNN